ncbi:hypothetical protein PVL29_012780 [Vitis rotundifolia]|uniref:F-box domain-containing protein n=1 Tax=Vitis rotundifolia TaxID=103349 RepID=A0AA39DMQ9_VITRO|nr:hypothetical protein PVL29_012780 [Vitis rotundifolia]
MMRRSDKEKAEKSMLEASSSSELGTPVKRRSGKEKTEESMLEASSSSDLGTPMKRRSEKEKAENSMLEASCSSPVLVTPMKSRSGKVKAAEKAENSMLEASCSSPVLVTPMKSRSGKVKAAEKVEKSMLEALSSSSVPGTPMKCRSGKEKAEEKAESMLEAMPNDILNSIVCCLDHDHLKQLFHVSNRIRDVTLAAKESHFAYRTPSKVLPFQRPLDSEESSSFDDIQTPDAPKQSRPLRRRKFSGIGIEPFPSDEER